MKDDEAGVLLMGPGTDCLRCTPADTKKPAGLLAQLAG